MPSDTIPLLPNEPRVADSAKQGALTAQYLTPALPAIEALLLSVRAEIDAALQPAKPTKLGKPYPLGQCLEISKALVDRLGAALHQPATGLIKQGAEAIAAFAEQGGVVRQVWGDLRGEFFQNAFLFGTLYVDVANDTVVATKPKVEILSLADARFIPLKDFMHFAQLASRYWKSDIYPNHALPALAPHFPLISVSAEGGVRLQSVSDYMIALTERNGFQPSRNVLHANPMSEDVFNAIKKRLEGTGFATPADPAQGREQAIAQCDTLRQELAGLTHPARDSYVRAAIGANELLGKIVVQTAAA